MCRIQTEALIIVVETAVILAFVASIDLRCSAERGVRSRVLALATAIRANNHCSRRRRRLG